MKFSLLKRKQFSQIIITFLVRAGAFQSQEKLEKSIQNIGKMTVLFATFWALFLFVYIGRDWSFYFATDLWSCCVFFFSPIRRIWSDCLFAPAFVQTSNVGVFWIVRYIIIIWAQFTFSFHACRSLAQCEIPLCNHLCCDMRDKRYGRKKTNKKHIQTA